MPDLKSELSKVLQSWEEPTTMTPLPATVTTNSTRRTFDFVRDNPGLTRSAVIQALEAGGIPQSSSRSLLSTFVLNGNVRESNGLLYANQQEYAPLKRRADLPKRTNRAQVVEAPTPAAEVPVVAEPVVEEPTPFSVAAILDTLTVRQARAVYDELKHIFGG